MLVAARRFLNRTSRRTRRDSPRGLFLQPLRPSALRELHQALRGRRFDFNHAVTCVPMDATLARFEGPESKRH